LNIAVSVKPGWTPNAANPARMPALLSISRRVVIARSSLQTADSNANIQFVDIRQGHFQAAMTNSCLDE
jgi:hypothetical protein